MSEASQPSGPDLEAGVPESDLADGGIRETRLPQVSKDAPEIRGDALAARDALIELQSQLADKRLAHLCRNVFRYWSSV